MKESQGLTCISKARYISLWGEGMETEGCRILLTWERILAWSRTRAELIARFLACLVLLFGATFILFSSDTLCSWHGKKRKITDNGNVMFAISHSHIHTWKNWRGVSITLFPLRMKLDSSTSSYMEPSFCWTPRTTSPIVHSSCIWGMCIIHKRQQD